MIKKISKITLLSFIVVVITLTVIIFSSTYLTRCFYHFFRFGVYDYKYLPTKTINASDAPVHFEKQIKSSKELFANLKYFDEKIEDFDNYLESHATTAFIIMKNDTIIYENYFNGHSRDTLCKAFSITKSFISALIGIAIDEGHIESIDDPIKKYFPELKNAGLEKLTIKHCLTGKTGLKYRKGAWPWYEQARMYYTTDVRKYLEDVKLSNEPGSIWRTNELSPLLLGIVIERATKTSISQYLEEKLWKPLGMESKALFVIDSEKNSFEKVESGLVAKPVDFLKFGNLYLHKGNWNGEQIIPKKWIVDSTEPNLAFVYYLNNYYKYIWWGYNRENDIFEYSANGHFSQRIYISPSNNTVVVRFGTDAAGVSWSKFISETIKAANSH